MRFQKFCATCLRSWPRVTAVLTGRPPRPRLAALQRVLRTWGGTGLATGPPVSTGPIPPPTCTTSTLSVAFQGMWLPSRSCDCVGRSGWPPMNRGFFRSDFIRDARFCGVWSYISPSLLSVINSVASRSHFSCFQVFVGILFLCVTELYPQFIRFPLSRTISLCL